MTTESRVGGWCWAVVPEEWKLEAAGPKSSRDGKNGALGASHTAWDVSLSCPCANKRATREAAVPGTEPVCQVPALWCEARRDDRSASGGSPSRERWSCGLF